MGKVDTARICVIGAGVAGLVTAKVLSQDGFDVTVFEKEPTVGGVWAPSRAYPGLRTNNPRETYAFSDFPYPEATEDFPTASRVMEYLASYAEHFGLEPCLRRSTRVLSVSRATSRRSGSHGGFHVRFQAADESAEPEIRHFDFVVVCNGVFSEPYVPTPEGVQRFSGQILHSSRIRSPDTLRGRRVVVVGGGKSALDCATFAAREGASSTLVCRSPHWMLPRYVGRTRLDRFAFLRLSVTPYYPAYHTVGRAERAFRIATAPLLWLGRKGMSRLVVRLSGIPDAMVPQYPHVAGIENQGIGEEFYRVLANGRAQVRRAGIASFPSANRVRLDTGEELEADVVVFATGWRQAVPFLDEDLRRDVQREGHFSLYRNILPPREPRLAFIGYASSGNAPLTSEMAAHWLSEFFLGGLDLPEPCSMEHEIARVDRWAATVFPRRNQGYFIGAYVAQYIDELLRDMGLPARRCANLLSEYLQPLWAERYRAVADERRQLGRRRANGRDGRPMPNGPRG